MLFVYPNYYISKYVIDRYAKTNLYIFVFEENINLYFLNLIGVVVKKKS